MWQNWTFKSVCRKTQEQGKVEYIEHPTTVAQSPRDSNDSSNEKCTFYINKLKTVTVNVAGEEIEMIVDSGASCNIINSAVRDRLRSRGIKFKEM